MSLDEAIILALRAVAAAMESRPTPDTVEVGVIDAKTKTFRKLSREEVEKYLAEIP